MTRYFALCFAFIVLTSVNCILAAGPPNSSLFPVDIFVAVEGESPATAKIKITAGDATEFKVVQAIVGSFEQVDDNNVWLSVVQVDKPIHAPRTTGDRHIGIKLGADEIELYVTEAMPYSVTKRLAGVLMQIAPTKRIVVKSTLELSELFMTEQASKSGLPPGKDPFAG